MASLSSIHSALITKLEGLFPNKTQFNAVEIEDNPPQFMIDGWGIRVEGGSPIDQDIVPNDYVFATNRTFSIVFIKRVYDLQTSMASYNTMVGLIGDDKDTLLSSMLDFAKVAGMKGGEEVGYSGDNGIEELKTGEKHFIKMEISFAFELTQEINKQ